MALGNKLVDLRKKNGLTQGEVANQLGVSRQSIIDWENNQVTPDIKNLSALAQFYKVGNDYFSCEDDVDWTSAWSKKYPILASYQGINGIELYREQMEKLYDGFKQEYQLSDVDTVLILKDILYQKYKVAKKVQQ